MLPSFSLVCILPLKGGSKWKKLNNYVEGKWKNFLRRVPVTGNSKVFMWCLQLRIHLLSFWEKQILTSVIEIQKENRVGRGGGGGNHALFFKDN